MLPLRTPQPAAATSWTTALVQAAAAGQLGAARLLLDRGASAGLAAGDGGTPLMAAAQASCLPLVLLPPRRRGPRPWNLVQGL